MTNTTSPPFAGFVPRPPSARARLTAAATRVTLRPISNSLPANMFGVAIARQIVAGSMTTLGSRARRTRVEKIDRPIPGVGRLRGEWVRAGETREDAALLYLHGSGYALCSTRTHRGLASRLSAKTGLPVFSVDYRLAPRYRFPAAADDVRRAFDWLVTQVGSPERLVLAGDSAGGHLAIDLCLEQLRAGEPLPAAQVLFSPLMDVTFGLARQREKIRTDPMISADAAQALLSHYVAQADPTHARLKHAVAEGEILPPTLIQAGGAEMLAADAHALHRMLEDSGTVAHLEVWPGQMHVFQALDRLVPEADAALNRSARFLNQHLTAGSASIATNRARTA